MALIAGDLAACETPNWVPAHPRSTSDKASGDGSSFDLRRGIFESNWSREVQIVCTLVPKQPEPKRFIHERFDGRGLPFAAAAGRALAHLVELAGNVA
jgi:hypothetical protein